MFVCDRFMIRRGRFGHASAPMHPYKHQQRHHHSRACNRGSPCSSMSLALALFFNFEMLLRFHEKCFYTFVNELKTNSWNVFENVDQQLHVQRSKHETKKGIPERCGSQGHTFTMLDFEKEVQDINHRAAWSATASSCRGSGKWSTMIGLCWAEHLHFELASQRMNPLRSKSILHSWLLHRCGRALQLPGKKWINISSRLSPRGNIEVAT